MTLSPLSRRSCKLTHAHLLILAILSIISIKITTSTHFHSTFTLPDPCENTTQTCHVISSLSVLGSTYFMVQGVESHRQQIFVKLEWDGEERSVAMANWTRLYETVQWMDEWDGLGGEEVPVDPPNDSRDEDTLWKPLASLQRDTSPQTLGDTPSSVISKIFAAPETISNPTPASYLYFITSSCTIYRNALNNALALPKEKLRLSALSQVSLSFIDVAVKMPYAYILAELPTDPKVVVIRVNLKDFTSVHLMQYSLGGELSSITWMSMIQHAENLYLAGNQISRGERAITGPADSTPISREFDPLLYSAMVNRISLPAFDNTYTFQLFDQSHQITSVVADELRNSILYASVLDHTSAVSTAKFYVFNWNNSDVTSMPLNFQRDPQSQFSELIFFSQREVNFTSVLVGLEDTLYALNITYPWEQHRKEESSHHEMRHPTIKLDKIALFNSSTVVHMARLHDDRLLVLASHENCKSCLSGFIYDVLPDVPPSDKVTLPPWIVVLFIGFLIAVEYVCIVGMCVGTYMWSKQRQQKRKDSMQSSYESIEDEDIQATP